MNPFWSKRVQEEVREARPEGLPPVPQSGDEEEPVRTPVKAAEEEAAAKRNRARAFMSPEERLADEKREAALQAVKRDLMRVGGDGPPEEGWRSKGPSGGGGEDWDGAGSAGDKGRPSTPEDRLEGELSRVMMEYGTVNMNLAEALRQRNELRHKVEQLELEKIVVEAEAEQNRRMAELIPGAAGREARGALDRADHGAGTTASAISHAAAGGGAAATEARDTPTAASRNSVQEAEVGDDAGWHQGAAGSTPV